jgi:phytoene dehydrogenase-like protein
MSAAYDVIVLGANLDGLAAAALIAKRGKRVLLLEESESIGGAHVTEEIAPGFRCDTVEHDLGWIPASVEKELTPNVGFVRHDVSAVALLGARETLVLSTDRTRAADAIRRHSAKDADQWSAFGDRIARLAGFLEALYVNRAPRPLSSQASDLASMLGLGRRARSLGRDGIFDALRTLPLSVADLLDEHFESDALKGLLASSGTTRILQGPRSGGTAFVFLHHHVGTPAGAIRSRRVVRGGLGVFAKALGECATRLGAALRTNAAIDRITMRDDRVSGVVLRGGEEIEARAVVSSLGARRTFFDLLDPVCVEPELAEAVSRIKHRGVCAKVNLALDSIPGLDLASLGAALVVAPSVSELERGYDAAKHGGVSSSPYLEVRVPTAHDPSLAPAGKQVMSVLVQWAPYHLTRETWDAARADALGDIVVRMLSDRLPGLADRIIAREVLTPVDLEQRYGLTEGSLTHGELTLDQILFMRPIPGWARHATPIDSLFLAGPGTHPGLPGASAPLVARAVHDFLNDKKQKRQHAKRLAAR